MEEKEELHCPICGSDRMAPILYGYPTLKWIDMAKLELVALGGLRDVGHTHYCYSCNEIYPSTENL